MRAYPRVHPSLSWASIRSYFVLPPRLIACFVLNELCMLLYYGGLLYVQLPYLYAILGCAPWESYDSYPNVHVIYSRLRVLTASNPSPVGGLAHVCKVSRSTVNPSLDLDTAKKLSRRPRSISIVLA